MTRQSLAASGASAFWGPHADSNDNVYALVLSSGSMRVYKSTEPTSSAWSEVDSTNRPSAMSGVFGQFIGGGTIRFFYYRNATTFSWSDFHTSDHATTPDQWANVDTDVFTMGSPPGAQRGGGLGTRSVGTFVYFHSGNEKVHGTDYYRSQYSYTGSTGNNFDSGDSGDQVNYHAVGCTGGVASNDVCLVRWDETNTLIEARILNSSNTLETIYSVSESTKPGAYGQQYQWTQSTYLHYLIGWKLVTGSDKSVFGFREDAAPDVWDADANGGDT